MNLRFIAGLAIMGFTILFAGCKQENKAYTEQNSGVVAFPDAGVALDVGSGWKRVDVSPGPPVCPPTLIGEHGVVRAMLFAPDRSNLDTAANTLRSMFDGNPEAVPDSFLQEEFATESGLRGLHISYLNRSQEGGKAVEMRSHNYIVTNHAGRCVSISYLTPAPKDSEVVHQMIRKSLRLQ